MILKNEIIGNLHFFLVLLWNTGMHVLLGYTAAYRLGQWQAKTVCLSRITLPLSSMPHFLLVS